MRYATCIHATCVYYMRQRLTRVFILKTIVGNQSNQFEQSCEHVAGIGCSICDVRMHYYTSQTIDDADQQLDALTHRMVGLSGRLDAIVKGATLIQIFRPGRKIYIFMNTGKIRPSVVSHANLCWLAWQRSAGS